MTEDQVVVIYEYAASMMPREGQWSKPTSAAEILAHQFALRNVPFELACLAVTILMTEHGKWPSPWELLGQAKELVADLSLERAIWKYGDEMDEAVEHVRLVAQACLAANDEFAHLFSTGNELSK